MKPKAIFATVPGLHFTLKMSQAFAILQMSQMDLASFLQEEIDRNPLLKEKSFFSGKTTFPEPPLTLSYYEEISIQIRDNFLSSQDQKMALLLLEYLDDRGFLAKNLEEIAEETLVSQKCLEGILSVLQTFYPPGLFARNLQESFLIQLRAQGLEKTAVFALVQNHLDDFLAGRYKIIQQKIAMIDMGEAIHKLALLQWRPLDVFQKEIVSAVIPDLILEHQEGKWSVRLTDEIVPQFEVDTQYDVCNVGLDEKKTLNMWRSQGKWLLYVLKKREEILVEIGKRILARQAPYLLSEGNLQLLTVDELGEALSLHPSTIHRALAHKYIQTPRGVMPFQMLVNGFPEKIEIKEILQSLVEKEDRNKPLTDEEIMERLLSKNYPIARRTVAKYRRECKIPSAKARRYRS